jgi:hypothetical protein
LIKALRTILIGGRGDAVRSNNAWQGIREWEKLVSQAERE